MKPSIEAAFLALVVFVSSWGGLQGSPALAQEIPLNTDALYYAWSNGPDLAPGTPEHHCELRIDWTEGVMSLVKIRSASDEPGEPVGLFRGAVPAGLESELVDLMERTRLADLPPAEAGMPGVSVMRLEYRRGDRGISKQLTGMDIPLLEQIDPLLEKLDGLCVSLQRSPLCALQAGVELVKAKKKRRFRLTLTNIGTQPIQLRDPRWLQEDVPSAWAGVRVARFPEEEPGVTAPPLEWMLLPLAAPKGVTPPDEEHPGAFVVIRPGESFAAETPDWEPPNGGGRHLAQGVWRDYFGGGDQEGVHRLRGAAFSEGIETQP